jgi:hypothetical protein
MVSDFSWHCANEKFKSISLGSIEKLLGLFEVAGLLLRIVSLFASNPYEYRKGWPDITIRKDGLLRVAEMKAPGDALGKSQRTIATTFATPLGLDFSVAAVTASTEPVH